MAPIETPRLRLRLPDAADAQPCMAIFRDPEVVEKKQVTLTEAPVSSSLSTQAFAAQASLSNVPALIEPLRRRVSMFRTLGGKDDASSSRTRHRR